MASPISLDMLPFLRSAVGQHWLAVLAADQVTDANHLAWATRLRRHFTIGQVQALLETTLLRQRARKKFSHADVMYFTRTALEQASAEPVAAYRAKRFKEAGAMTVADLCCGIGGDSLGFAASGQRVIGVDIDPLRIAMAKANLEVCGFGEQFDGRQADILHMDPMSLDGVQYFFCDPGRRNEQSKRILSLFAYRPPPLDVWQKWRPFTRGAAFKISPGVDYSELPEGAEVSFVSFDGDVREGVLWFGDLRTGSARSAILLPGSHTMSSAELPRERTPVKEVQEYLYEPDGAVIRAHLVQALAARLSASMVDADIAYLTSPRLATTPFAQAFRVEDCFPFQLKRLRTYLRLRNIGQVTVKKRGSPLDPQWLAAQLRLKGDGICTLLLTRVQGTHTVIVAQPLPVANLGNVTRQRSKGSEA